MNELTNRATSKVPEKPDYLSTYEMIEEMRIPLLAGGYMDQPHLWLIEYRVINQTVKLMEALNNLANQGTNNAREKL